MRMARRRSKGSTAAEYRPGEAPYGPRRPRGEGLHQAVGPPGEPGGATRVGRALVDERGEARVDRCRRPGPCPGVGDRAVEPAGLRGHARVLDPDVEPERRGLATTGPGDGARDDRAADRDGQGQPAQQQRDVGAGQRDRSQAQRLHDRDGLVELAALDGVRARVGVDVAGVHVEDGAGRVAHEVAEQLRPLHRRGVRVHAGGQAGARPGRREEVRDGAARVRAVARDHRHAHAARAHPLHAVGQRLHRGRERAGQHRRVARRPGQRLGAHAVLDGQQGGVGPAGRGLERAVEMEDLDGEDDAPGVAGIGRVHDPAHGHHLGPVRPLDAQTGRVVAAQDALVEQDHLVTRGREHAAQERAHGPRSDDEHPGQGAWPSAVLTGALRGAWGRGRRTRRSSWDRGGHSWRAATPVSQRPYPTDEDRTGRERDDVSRRPAHRPARRPAKVPWPGWRPCPRPGTPAPGSPPDAGCARRSRSRSASGRSPSRTPPSPRPSP